MSDRERTAELIDTVRELETLLSVVAHDLKEPARAIQMFSELLSQRIGDSLDAKSGDYLRRMVRAADRMHLLLDDVVSFSLARKMKAPTTQIPLERIIQDACARLEVRIRETNAQLRLEGPFPSLRADLMWATEAVYNLIDNAINFVGRGGAVPVVDVAYYSGPEGVGVVVKDRGMGVSAQDAEKIFDLFARRVGREVDGTGAGLAIVREVAERHGGRAWVMPRPGGGSEFYVTFAPHSSGDCA